MSLGPFDLTGTQFLLLYLALLVPVVLAGLIIPARMRPAGRQQTVSDVDQLALLAGGGARLADAVVARLLAANRLVMIDAKSFRAVSPDGATPVERGLLGLPGTIRWSELQDMVKSYREPLERRMVAAGLLAGEAEAARLRCGAILPYAALLGFGAIKWAVGISRDRPVGYLSMLLVLTGLLALIRWFSVDRRTKARIDAVAAAAGGANRLRMAPTHAEMDLAVALFGTSVLAGSAWSDFHRLRRASGGDSGIGIGGDCGGGGDGGGGDGGGGCGGGCGGCGG